ncbi:bone marrow proteoglycan [Erinaceus europaeus]|uniref:Bone marrow proteoglycan n=1 Tax=Erinaceus europaeus TaxID=9365 RepID=A0A1S3W6I3_ERIEU|nr:bone marrow proteoglycan [Erinaceus europaeus]XP_016042098.1 bone marrow proteoglycan [Erinaceus europaeus]
MNLPLLLALLFGAASALHLRTDLSNVENHLGDETLPQDREMSENEAKEASVGELMQLEGGEEDGSGSEDAPVEEGALEEEDKDFQCPKEEDTAQLEGNPGCKTYRLLLIRRAMDFNQAQLTCRRCYRGNLASVHNYSTNYRIHCSVRGLNQGQVWIGGYISRWGNKRCFHWIDGSSWNFGYWASGQPSAGGGRCVTLCTRGGHWRLANCARQLPFVCSY